MAGETRSFIGPLTEKAQKHWDTYVAAEELMTFAPEGCQNCRELRYLKVGNIATRVVQEEINMTKGFQEVIAYTTGCAGIQYSPTHADSQPICPPYEAEKRSWSKS